jgi:hypothetical protein
VSSIEYLCLRMNLPENRRPLFGIMRFRSRTVLPGDYYFGAMRPPKRNVPPRRAALFSFYCGGPPCQSTRLNCAASADFKGKPVGS